MSNHWDQLAAMARPKSSGKELSVDEVNSKIDELSERLEALERKPEEQPPKCHFTPMEFEWADDGCQQVEYWICKHCGHTKEICRSLAG